MNYGICASKELSKISGTFLYGVPHHLCGETQMNKGLSKVIAVYPRLGRQKVQFDVMALAFERIVDKI